MPESTHQQSRGWTPTVPREAFADVSTPIFDSVVADLGDPYGPMDEFDIHLAGSDAMIATAAEQAPILARTHGWLSVMDVLDGVSS